MMERSDRTLAFWLALVLFGVYLLSFSGRFYSQDSMLMFSVAESFVKRGEFNADQMWTVYKARAELGPDGEAYSKTGYGASLFAAPLYALALNLPGELGMTQTTLLTSSIVIALAGALVFLAARRLRFSRGASALTALLFGLATPAWVYAKQFWSEPYALLTLFAAFYFLLCFRGEHHSRDALAAGIVLGLAVATRLTNAALVPVFAWYGFADVRSSNPARRGLARFALALGVIALTIAYYNWARYGSPLTTGYRADETFDNPILLGMYGLLFSPGKGLFVYTPLLTALSWSAIVFYRRARAEWLLIGVTFAFYLVLFSMWYYWWGGTNWGPRFLVPTLPFLVLLIAPAVELALTKPYRFAPVFFALCLLGFAIQLLGVAVPSLAYRARMLKLSPNAEWDAIFQPESSPLVGSLNLLRPTVLDFAWLRVVDGHAAIDWLVLALTVGFIVLCTPGLTTNLRRQIPVSGPRSAVVFIMFLFAAALSLFSLYRYRGDARFGGSDGYRALLQTVAREAQPRDVLILGDDARVLFFLNENRARLRWYGLSRDPRQFDDATRALLARLTQQYARIWFAFDDVTAELPDPTRAWLEQSLRLISARDFDEGAHLLLFATDAMP